MVTEHEVSLEVNCRNNIVLVSPSQENGLRCLNSESSKTKSALPM